MTDVGAFSAELTGLDSDTPYYYRAKATGSVTVYGEEQTFNTEKISPEVTTNAATGITDTTATLQGNLDGLGDYGTINVSFEWGTESGVYTDNTTPEAMTDVGAFATGLTGLDSDTPYYYRAKATGSVTVYGEEQTFNTEKTPPEVTTNAATDITDVTATRVGD